MSDPANLVSSEAERYQIHRLIKRGGMAELLEASLIGEGCFRRRVALKRLLPLQSPEQLAAFAEEARILSLLDHPGIVSILDYKLLDGLPVQVLEYVDGMDLGELAARSRAAERPLEPVVALHLAAELADALDAVHDARDEDGGPLGLVHRDVSPENVLVSRTGAVKLVDFGAALVPRRNSRSRSSASDAQPAFIAPELLYGEKATRRSDLFSLGCVVHFLFSGESPIGTNEARLAAVRGDPPVISSLLPPDLAAIVRTAIDPSPGRRFRSARELSQACNRALAERGARQPRAALIDWLERLRGQPIEGAVTPLPRLSMTVIEGAQRAAALERAPEVWENVPTVLRYLEKAASPERVRRIRWAAAVGISVLLVAGGLFALLVQATAAMEASHSARADLQPQPSGASVPGAASSVGD